jgi:hypothetical protein
MSAKLHGMVCNDDEARSMELQRMSQGSHSDSRVGLYPVVTQARSQTPGVQPSECTRALPMPTPPFSHRRESVFAW